jgi:glycosyltransferase involved in cell wall biosynthesis
MFSIVMAAYNAANYIGESIESILKQTYPHFELLIIDDGSSDTTLDIARGYEAQDERVRVIAKPSNSGISDTTNTGLRAARYDWIAILDSDDIATSDRLEKQAAAIAAQPQVIAWGGCAHYINEAGRLLYISELGPKSEAEFHDLRRRHQPIMFVHPTFTFRKDIALDVGGYSTHIRAAPDLELMDRIADKGVMLALPDILVHYRVYTNSVTFTKFARQEYEIRYVFERRADAGESPARMTWADYEAKAAQKSTWTKRSEAMQAQGRAHWYRAGLAFGERNLAGFAGNLALALLFSPRYTAAKLVGQVRRRVNR